MGNEISKTNILRASVSLQTHRTRNIRVLISSTNADMLQERSQIFTLAQPRLRRILRSFGWDITFVYLSCDKNIKHEDDSGLTRTISDSLSCDYMIAVLGEKYGDYFIRCSEEGYSSSITESYPWLTKYQEACVMEMQIRAVAFDSEGIASRCYFYIRSAEASQGGEAHSDHISHDNTEYGKLSSLKADIQKRFPVVSLRSDVDLVDEMVHDLTLAIRQDFEAILEGVFTEHKFHEIYALNKLRHFNGRTNVINWVKEKIEENRAEPHSPIVLYGKSGIGKTSVCAQIKALLDMSPSKSFIVLSHFVGCTPQSIHSESIGINLYSQLGYKLNKFHPNSDSSVIRSSLGELSAFEALIELTQTGKQRFYTFVLVIDGLNQMTPSEGENEPYSLHWLPSKLPRNVHIILSTVEDSSLPERHNKPIQKLMALGWDLFKVDELGQYEVENIVADYIQQSSHFLRESDIQNICALPSCKQPLYLKLLMDQVMRNGGMENTNRVLEILSSNSSIGFLLDYIIDYVWRIIYGSYQVERSMRIIAVSRIGISESTLYRFVGFHLTGIPYEEHIWNAFFSTLCNEILYESNGRFHVFHQILHSALNDRYTKSDLKRRETYSDYANYLELLLDGQIEIAEQYIREICYALNNAQSFERLAEFLLRKKVYSVYLSGTSRREYFSYLDIVRQHGFCHSETLTEMAKDTSTVGKYFVEFFREKGDYRLLEDIICARLKSLENEEEKGQEYIWLGMTLGSLERYDEAISRYNEALRINLQLHGRQHPIVATIYHNMGLLYRLQQKYREAALSYIKALQIQLETLGEEHTDVAATYNNIAVIYFLNEKLDDALDYFSKSLKIKRKILGPEHPEVALVLENLALIHERLLQYQDALDKVTEAHEILLRVVGPEHQTARKCGDTLARIKSKIEPA